MEDAGRCDHGLKILHVAGPGLVLELIDLVGHHGLQVHTLQNPETLARRLHEGTDYALLQPAQLVIEAAQKNLEEKRTALAEVSRLTEDEELHFQHERQKAIARINKGDLAAYERIRKAKKGMAVVPLKKGACGGCFNRVPPQKLLELRQNERMYTCERCGRIIVSDEIVELAKKPQ